MKMTVFSYLVCVHWPSATELSLQYWHPIMTVISRINRDRMSLKSRGRSPGGHARHDAGHSRHVDQVTARGGSLGPGPAGPAGSSYSSETEEIMLNESRHSSNNTSPSHTLAGHNTADTSNSIWYDEFDSSGLEPEKKQKALDLFQAKINKTKEQIKEEQNSRDANVDEYLRYFDIILILFLQYIIIIIIIIIVFCRLSSCADRHQLARIKQVSVVITLSHIHNSILCSFDSCLSYLGF